MRGRRIIGPINLEMAGDGTCVLIGPNGAGKTTLLRLLHGLSRLSRGQVCWGCEKSEARAHQAFVFQRPVLLRRSVQHNLMYPLLLRGHGKQEAEATAKIWAEKTGLKAHIKRPARLLSAGEQQKLALARALAIKPKLLFLDEPTASLDGRATRDVEDILRDARLNGTALILSTHDMGQARRFADRILFLLAGQIHEDAEAATFFDQPKTAEAAAFLKGDIV